MTTETLANLIAFKKRAFAAVAEKTVSGLGDKPELAERVEKFCESVAARDDQFWKNFRAKTEAFDSFCTKSEVLILEEIGPLTEDEDDAIRDAQDA